MATFVPVPSNPLSTVPAFGSAPFVSGFSLAVTGNTTMTVGPGTARALTNDNIIQFPSFTAGYAGPATVDISTVGVNGCYPVSIASLGLTYNTLFPVYAIKASSGTGLGSANANAGGTTTNTYSGFVVATGNNFLPPGYDTFVRIGWCPVAQATGYVLPFIQSGQNDEREYLYQDPVTVLSGGTEHTTPAEVNLSATTGMIPANKIQKVNLVVAVTGAAATSYVYLEPYGLTAGSVATTRINTPVASQVLALNVDMVAGVDGSGNTAITYIVDNGTAVTISISGFTDSLGNSLV